MAVAEMFRPARCEDPLAAAGVVCYNLTGFIDSRGWTMKTHCIRLMLAALTLIAGASAAAPPKQVLVTREVQDLYRVASGTFYMKTIGCQEYVYGDRADLKLNIGSKGAMLVFRNNHICVVDKFLREIDPKDIPASPTF